MKSTAKLKDQARRHEQREEWESAIDAYIRVLESAGERDVGDLPLYNRIGDLYLRLGRSTDAVVYYEKAATQYAEAELYNNAIALCNKALRYAPTRLDLLRKLGSYSARQGFLTDARHWFLEFAERAFRKGELDAAFEALDEFAEISDDAEVRELLARKLHGHGREQHALDEFRHAYAMRTRAGQSEAAEALRTEVAELFPDADLESEPAAQWSAGRGHSRSGALGLPTLSDDESEQVPAAHGLPGIEPTAPEAQREEPAESRPLEGFEQTSLSETEEEVAGSTTAEDVLDSAADAGIGVPVDAPEETDEPPLPPLPGYEEPADAEREAQSWEPSAGDGWPAPPPGTEEVGAAEAHAGDRFVDLSELLGVHDTPREETRYFVEETAPTGDEDRDFAELLAQFKEKLAEHLAHDDIGSHYDLGLAFKEMGLLDEAVSQFQVALRAGSTDRLKIYEELGHCFLLKGQHSVAVKVLSRALQFDHDDEIEMIGVYYLLGRAYEELKQATHAMDAYERVMGLDINFKDVAQRMARL